MRDITSIPAQRVQLSEKDTLNCTWNWFRFFNNQFTWLSRFIKPSVSTTASITSPLTPNSDQYDQYCATAQAGDFTIAADVGDPTDGLELTFRFLDNGTSRNITWTTGVAKGFRAIGVTLPTATVINKTVYIKCIYNAAAQRWDAYLVAQEV